MKILQISPSYKPAYIYGGPTMSVSELGEQLAKSGLQVSVYTTTANGKTELDVPTNQVTMINGVAVTFFRRLTKDHTHFSPALLLKTWKTAKEFDVIHIHGWWNLVSVLSAFIAVLRKRPVIVSPRGMLSSYSFRHRHSFLKKLIHQLLGAPILKKCSRHVTSQFEYEANVLLAPAKNIFNIPNFVKLSNHSNLKVLTDHKTPIKLLFFSRIDEKKGIDIFLRALPELNFSYQVTIAGNGSPFYIKELKTLAESMGVAKNIDWIGFQKENKFEVLAAHDVMVLPSHDENFANVVIESLSVGTAVLVSENVGLADYVASEQLGWVCKTTTPSVRDQLNLINDNYDELAKISKISPGKIIEHFGETVLLKQYMAMYQAVANGRNI